MPSFCVVSNCEYKYTHAENVSFHKFPYQSPEILAKWIKFTDRGPKWHPSRWSAICSRHFLPSDFRNLISRKCLKKDAVPSVTIKQFTGNFLDLQNSNNGDKADSKLYDGNLQVANEEQLDWDCRLCGSCCKTVDTFVTNFEVFGMIQKCFPTLNIQRDDELPKNICSVCLDRLNLFSDFVDEVLNTQRELEAKFNNEQSPSQILHIGKSFKIKQEPIIKVKQEVNEVVFNPINDDYDNEANEEQDDCDQKSQLQRSLPIINSEEIIKNCDIMEVITLEDAFIDIPDDEAGEDDSSTVSPLKPSPVIVNPTEHDYAKPSDSVENVNQQGYKTEQNEEPESESVPPSMPNIIVIDESIVKTGPSIPYLQCDVCAMASPNEITLAEHKLVYHSPGPRKCVECNLEFFSVYEFLRHRNKFHKSTKGRLMKKKTNLNCPMCDKSFTSKLALNNHRKYICDYQHEQEYECKHCGKKLNRWIVLRRHEKTCRSVGVGPLIVSENKGHKKSSSISSTLSQLTPNSIFTGIKSKPYEKLEYVCPICGRSYSRRHNLFKHQVTHRPASLWNHKCGDCNKLFDHIYDLRRHLKTKVCSKESYLDSLKSPPELFFICTICGKQLKTLQRLKLHSASHSGKKPYVCESCGKSFSHISNLYQHHITHSDVRRYKCDLCEKAFKRRGGLNQHKRAYHFKIKPHECPTCKHRYALKGDMIRCKHSLLKQ